MTWVPDTSTSIPSTGGRFVLDDPLVNQTAVPKGGAPTQLTQSQAEGFALYEKMLQAQKAVDRERAARPPGVSSFLENVGISGAKRYADALIAAPSIAADLGTIPTRLMRSALPSALGGRSFSLLPTPQYSTEDVAAGLKAATSPLSYQQARENIDLNEGARQSERPTSTTIGNVAGDIATVLSARLPVARSVVGMTGLPASPKAALQAVETMAPGIERHLNRIAARLPLRAFGKMAETGFEGATLALLHKGDPVDTALYSAAGQGAGSLALSAIRHPMYSMGAILAAGLGWQMFQNIIPGGRDRILESVEHGVRHATVGTILGGLAGLLGAGRFRGSRGLFAREGVPPLYGHGYAQDLPKFAEGVNAALRTTPNSMIEQWQADARDSKPILGPVMNKLSTDVTAFKDAELRRLSKAITGGNLRSTVQDMLKDPEFAGRMGY